LSHNRNDSKEGFLLPVQGLFDQALRHHQAGQLAEAERLYRRILALDPDHADSLHLLGVLAHQAGQLDIAADLIGRAIAVRADIPSFHNNLGNILKDQNRLNEAETRYRQALMLKPDYPEASNNLGVTLQSLGRLEDAATCCRRAVGLRPNYAEALFNLGNILKDQGKADDALAYFQKSMEIAPDADAHTGVGDILQDQGKSDEAITHYKSALALKPDSPEALNGLGLSLVSRSRPDEAMPYYERAIILKPNSIEIIHNLGNLLVGRGKIDDAVALLMRGLALKPDSPALLHSLGLAFAAKERFDEAVEYYRRAIACDPAYWLSYCNIGALLHSLGRVDESVAFLTDALALEPDSAHILNNLGATYKDTGNLDEAIKCFRRAIMCKPELAAVSYSNLLMTMVYTASIFPQELTATAREFGERIANPLLRARPLPCDADPERKLRIGYVSPDLRDHAVNYFLGPLIKLHDRKQFEVFAYSCNKTDDAVTSRLKRDFDHWRDIKTLNDDQAADLIEADQIDILVDLAGHTGDNRLLVFARKPAPIQVTWLGYPATTGMKAMDYRITDIHAEPVGMTEHLNTEMLWRLPEMFCCYQAHVNSPAVIDHPPFEDNGYVTFGCFNNFAKVTNPVLAAWAKIMAQTPESHLLLEIRGLESPQFRSEVEERLRRFGLPVDRILLEPRKRSNQFALYNRIDIALDPFPCAGGTTSMDTLWMGVPFVTLAGGHFVSRMGVTILTNAGMPELIATTIDEYVKLTTNLALDKDRLRGLRHNLQDRVAASPLMNQAAFTHNIEAAYRQMWRRWCADNAVEKQARDPQ
jgi:protein O-GlcNAc transferase